MTRQPVCIRVGGLERVSHRLDLPRAPGGILDPGGESKLRAQLVALGIIRLELFQLAFKARLQKALDGFTECGPTVTWVVGHKESPFGLACIKHRRISGIRARGE